MARYWKRGTDRSIERLLRTNRATPREDFASSLIQRIEGGMAQRPRVAPQRFRLALATTVVLIAIAAVLGGISAASAGVGSIVHAATAIVTPAHTDASLSGKQQPSQNTSQTTSQGSSAQDQYSVGICHRTGNGSFHLIYVGQSAVPAHLAHGDHYPVSGHC